MNNYIKIVFFIGVSLLVFSCQQGTSNTPEKITEQTPRIISLSGFLTEVLVELGHGDQLVGRDVTSTFPKTLVEKLPSIGHVSQLNAEAILELQPTLIFTEANQIKKSEVFQQLKNAGIKIVAVPTSTHLGNSVKAANEIVKHLSTDSVKIKTLVQKIETDSLALMALLARFSDQPKVLFIYARGAGRLMVAGKNTSASAIIKKAGGKNAIESFEDFRAMTAEALVEAAPDVILMFTSGLASLDGKKGLEQITGISQTPAFKNNRIITMDGHYLTVFGTRVGKAAIELANKIHQRSPSPSL